MSETRAGSFLIKVYVYLGLFPAELFNVGNHFSGFTCLCVKRGKLRLRASDLPETTQPALMGN